MLPRTCTSLISDFMVELIHIAHQECRKLHRVHRGSIPACTVMGALYDDVSLFLLPTGYSNTLNHRLVLYMMYYPVHLKYTIVDVDQHDNRPPQHIKTGVKQDAWRLSITLAWVVFLYTYVDYPASFRQLTWLSAF